MHRVLRMVLSRPLVAALVVGSVSVGGQFLTNGNSSWGSRLGSSAAAATVSYVLLRLAPGKNPVDRF
jgi:uncharacterized membrane protein (UPF0136 family)